jgi:hypothetical protein
VQGTFVHLRLGFAALCGVDGRPPGTRDASAVTCQACRALIAASGLALHRDPEPEIWHVTMNGAPAGNPSDVAREGSC